MIKFVCLIAIFALVGAQNQWPQIEIPLSPNQQWANNPRPQPPRPQQPLPPVWEPLPPVQQPRPPVNQPGPEMGRPGVRDSRCPATNNRLSTIFAHESQCNMFYMCNDGLRYTFDCPRGLNFDRVRQICDRPGAVRC